jgi:hypothetical protein
VAVTSSARPIPSLRRFCAAKDDPALLWLGEPARWLLSTNKRLTRVLVAWLGIFFVSFHHGQQHSPGRSLLFSLWFPLWMLAMLAGPYSKGPGPLRRALSWRMIVRRARHAARPVDAASLEAVPDGVVVRATGRERARECLARRVDGRTCVGVAIRTSGLSETVHDFDLVDADGRSIFVPVADARVLAAPNVDFSGADFNEHNLIGSLALPVGALTPPLRACALHEGDVVTVIGFKQTLADARDPAGHDRQSRLRAAIGSSASRPLLVVPAPAHSTS